MGFRFAVEHHVEFVQGEGERVQPVLGETGPRVETVVADQRIDECFALDQHPLAGVAELAADRHGDQHADQRSMEDQVPDFLGEAAFGADRGPVCVRIAHVHPVAAALQQPRGIFDRRACGDAGFGRDRHGTVLGQPGQPARSPRRLRPHGLVVLDGARDDAANQRQEQQQVDGGEPHRGVDVEELEAVQPRTHVRDCPRGIGSPRRGWPGAAGRVSPGPPPPPTAAAGTARSACWSAGSRPSAACQGSPRRERRRRPACGCGLRSVAGTALPPPVSGPPGAGAPASSGRRAPSGV